MRHFLLCILAIFPTITFAADVKITKPEGDRLTMEPAIAVEGTGSPEGGIVNININGPGGTAVSTRILGGRWSSSNLSLLPGLNIIDAAIGDKRIAIIVVRGSDGIERRPHQKVRFVWNAGVDDQLRKLATGSLSAVLSEQQLVYFTSAVEARVVEVFSAFYKSLDVEVVAVAGPDVHTMSMLAIDDSLFGSSPFDCGNLKPKEISEIHVGTYRRSMTEEFDRWLPMRKEDTLDVRIEDVAQALGRTSAHEFGHALGLVGEAEDRRCVWMDGCDGGHNCEAFDDLHAEARRFDHGWHIMDPGGNTDDNARLAEPDTKQRTNPRVPAIFEPFGLSYLVTILPRS